jgi:MFS family permease
VTRSNSLWLPLYLPTLLLSFATGMLVPILPLYARSFDISYSLVGVVLAAQGMGNLMADVPAGILLGRLGHRRTMILGVGLLGLAVGAMSWARSVPELVAYGLAAGVGNAMWNISRHAYMTSHVTLQQRGRATATFGGLNRIGTFAGPAVGAALGAMVGLWFPFLIYAGVAFVALIMSALFVEDTGEPVHHRGGLRGHGLHLYRVIHDHFRIFSTAGAGQLFAQMIRTGRTTLIPLYAADVVGLELPAIGLIITCASAVDMAMFYPAGLIMDRYGRKFAIVPSFAIQALGMALVPFTGSFGALLVATMIIGFGNGIGSGSMLTVGSDLAPKDGSMGEFLGVWRLIGDAGATGAPVVVGGVADLVGLSMATFVIASMGLAASAIFGLLVPETLRAQPVVTQAEA